MGIKLLLPLVAIFLVFALVQQASGMKMQPKACQLPKETGPCRAYMARYYYDSQTKSCRIFIYGGCQGNSNNFLTKSACESTCSLYL